MEWSSTTRLGSRLMNNSGMSFLASLSMIMPLTPRSHGVWPEHITGQEGERGRERDRQTEEGERVCMCVFFVCVCLSSHPSHNKTRWPWRVRIRWYFSTVITGPSCFFKIADNLTSSVCCGDLIVLSSISESLVYPIWTALQPKYCIISDIWALACAHSLELGNCRVVSGRQTGNGQMWITIPILCPALTQTVGDP